MYFQGFCPWPPELIELNQAVLAILPFRSRWNQYLGISGKGAYIGLHMDHPLLWLLLGYKGVPCGSIGPQVARAQLIWSAGCVCTALVVRRSRAHGVFPRFFAFFSQFSRNFPRFFRDLYFSCSPTLPLGDF